MREEVAITGRLASMSREDAIAQIQKAGGRYVERPTPSTSTLVVGQDGPPLGVDGHLTKSLQAAQRLQGEGHDIRIVPESEWIDALGLESVTASGLHSASRLAGMIDVPRATIRSWVRQGLLRPALVVRRLQLFGFQEVAHARALKRLLDAGTSPARIRESLRRLHTWLPDAGCGPSQLDQTEGVLVVRTEDGQWAEASGQLRLDFEEAVAVREPSLRALRPSRTQFEQGIQAEEEGRLEDAAALYERAIALSGPRSEICFNLGNVLYALNRTSEAASRFREATSLESDYVEAWNNLGNMLAELGESLEALRAFRHALAIEPLYADAHFNLAETLAEMGQDAEARRHWHTYLTLDSHSDWAEEARRRLQNR